MSRIASRTESRAQITRSMVAFAMRATNVGGRVLANQQKNGNQSPNVARPKSETIVGFSPGGAGMAGLTVRECHVRTNPRRID